ISERLADRPLGAGRGVGIPRAPAAAGRTADGRRLGADPDRLRNGALESVSDRKPVIPAKAGISLSFQAPVERQRDSSFRWNDDRVPRVRAFPSRERNKGNPTPAARGEQIEAGHADG